MSEVKYPLKLKDLGSSNILMAIEKKFSGHALIDLGALHIYDLHSLGEPKPTYGLCNQWTSSCLA